MTSFWVVLALSAGVMLGFLLCAALTMSREGQRREAQAGVPAGMHPLDTDSRF